MLIKSLTDIRYRRFLFSANDYFLTEKSGLSAGINYFIQCPNNVNGQLNEFYTLLTDLSQPENEIWQGIYHRTRSEINSFINNQDFRHGLLFDLKDKALNEYIALFNAFAAHKKIRKAETARLKAYNKQGLLAISFIQQQGHLLCINFYRVNMLRATNLYSFTLRHDQAAAFNSSHTGRAHRTLHWLDMLKFKAMQVSHYDFCGWYPGTEDKARLNINAFKEQFTKHKVKEYSGVIYKNKLLLLLLKLIK